MTDVFKGAKQGWTQAVGVESIPGWKVCFLISVSYLEWLDHKYK